MDQYKIIRKLGQGPQSVSYLANPIDKPNEVVVLKRIASNVVRPSDVSVFLKLRHPNIVPCLAALQHEDQLVLVTPYYEGGDLEHHLEALQKAKKKLDPMNVVVKWTVQLVRALQYCHEQKVIHRDLKLSNIFISKDLSRIYLGGFGLARALDKSMSTATTLVGSPVNLSPEVISGQPYSFSSDVWSLGCLVYEMLTFEKPFSSASFAQVVMKVCNGQYEPLPKEIPMFLSNAVNGMLQVDVKQRFLLAEVVESDTSFLQADKEEKTHLIAETPVRNNNNNNGGKRVSKSPSQRGRSEEAIHNNQNKIHNQQQQDVHQVVEEEDDEDDQDDDQDRVTKALSASEELEQWAQWKFREFAQIENALKKIGSDEENINLLMATATAKNKQLQNVVVASNSNSNSSAAANNNKKPTAASADLDPKRAAQKLLASPRRQQQQQQKDVVQLPLAPPPSVAAAAGRRAIVPTTSKNNNNHDANQQQAQQQQIESAEKRLAQRAELQKRIAEGRKKHTSEEASSSGNVVIATPSRGLFNNNNVEAKNSNKPQQQQQQQQQQRSSSQPSTPPQSSKQQQQALVATPPQQKQHQDNTKQDGKSNKDKHTSLREEIARRRAEVKASPRAATGGQPEVEILLPGNLKK